MGKMCIPTKSLLDIKIGFEIRESHLAAIHLVDCRVVHMIGLKHYVILCKSVLVDLSMHTTDLRCNYHCFV
jgi:hypothetical protein